MAGNKAKEPSPDRSRAEIDEDTLYAYKRRLLYGERYEDIAAAISERRGFFVSRQTVSKNLKEMKLSNYLSLLSCEQERASAAIFYSALAETTIVKGMVEGDVQFLRLAMDARWKMHQLAQEDFKDYLKLFEGADMGKITPEWKESLIDLFRQIEVEPGRKLKTTLGYGRASRGADAT